MSTVAVLPIKRFGDAKQRLAGHPARAALAEAMASDVLRALRDAPSIDAVVVVTGDGRAAQLGDELGAAVVSEGRRPWGHPRAAMEGIAHAIGLCDATRVLLVAGDTPLLSAADLDALLARHAQRGVVVFPDRHGTGTNALLLDPPHAIAPSFGEGSRERHERLAREAGVACVVDPVASLTRDVDTGEDLDVVRAALEADPERAPHTRSLLAWAEAS